MAGALDVELAGNAWYFGKLYEKPAIGDPLRKIKPEDIRKAHRLFYISFSHGKCITPHFKHRGIHLRVL